MNKKINYKDYETLSEFFKVARRKYPLVIFHSIQKFQRKYDIDFQTAYKFLLDKEIIIEL